MDSTSGRRTTRRSLTTGENFTPKTLIQGFLQTAQTTRMSPRKRARTTPGPKSSITPGPKSSVTPGPKPSMTPNPSSSSSSASSVRGRRARTPATLPRSASTRRRRSTRPEILATPGGSNPTPRGLITGFLQAADTRTPAVHAATTRRSSPRKQPTPAIRNDIQARIESPHSSSIESPFDAAPSRFTRPQPQRGGRTRRRQAINPEEFAAGVDERLSQEVQDKGEDVGGGGQESRDASTNRILLESIAEDPLDVSMPRPDSTTKNSSDLQLPSTGRSSARRPRVRRSLVQDDSIQIPSTSEGPSISANMSASGDRTSHQSRLSVDDESMLAHASQETLPIQRSFDADIDAEGDEAVGRREESVDERGEGQGGRIDDDEEKEAAEEEEEEGEMEVEERGAGLEDRDLDELHTDHAVAPTQPAVASVKKSSRARASPLRTPHLEARGRRSTPPAKTPGLFRQAQDRQEPQPVRAKAAQPTSPPRATRGKRVPPSSLPKSLTNSIFTHFSKARVPRNTLELVNEASSKFFRNASRDLMAYCNHAGRSTIEPSDVELLMRRQRLVSDKEPLNVLIEKYLPMEYRKELIPMARSGNKVYPKVPKK